MSVTHTLPALPWDKTALAPHISEQTITFHYGKHHAGYVKKLNAALENASAELQGKSLEEHIATSEGKVFNCAAQIWNHTFYWNCLSPNGGAEPTGQMAALIERDFGSFAAMKEQFNGLAGGHFGSGWAWLVQNAEGKLQLVQTHDAGNPKREGLKPILTCDVWEHAYYLDYQNKRGDYIGAFWNLVNWEFANTQLASAEN